MSKIIAPVIKYVNVILWHTYLFGILEICTSSELGNTVATPQITLPKKLMIKMCMYYATVCLL